MVNVELVLPRESPFGITRNSGPPCFPFFLILALGALSYSVIRLLRYELLHDSSLSLLSPPLVDVEVLADRDHPLPSEEVGE